MVKRIQGWLYRLLGRRAYLQLVSQLFFWTYRIGLLRSDPSYACHYYVQRLIEPGDCVIDIGANLGYYSVLFAEWVGPAGTVYSVEPVPLYRAILQKNVDKFPQVEVVPYALGDAPDTVQMGIPETVGSHRHGMMRILASDEGPFEAAVRSPTALFGELDQIDYVKCDIEGHEGVVLPAMDDLLREHAPILQVEVAPENRDRLYTMMTDMGYRAYFVQEEELVEIQGPDAQTQGDWIFMPSA